MRYTYRTNHMTAENYLNLGELSDKKGDFELAAFYYRCGIARGDADQDTDYFLHNNLGASYSSLGRHEEALTYLKLAMNIIPEYPDAYRNMSISYLGMKEYKRSAEALIAASKACPLGACA